MQILYKDIPNSVVSAIEHRGILAPLVFDKETGLTWAECIFNGVKIKSHPANGIGIKRMARCCRSVFQ